MSKKERYGVIYKITNTVNGKCYIGQTIHDFNKRYDRGVHGSKGIERVYKYHKYSKEHCLNYNRYLLRSIEKYGFEAFKVDEEFDVAYSKEKLDSLEKKYIKEFNCIENGYNDREGGSNGKPSEEALKRQSENRKGKCVGEDNVTSKPVWCFEYNRKFSSTREVEKILGINSSMISTICNKRESKAGKRVFRAKDTNGIMCNFVWYEDYIIMTNEERDNYVNTVEKEIHKRLSSKAKVRKNGNNQSVKIICLNDFNIFNSMKECASYYNISRQVVGNICNGIVKKSRTGLVFMYYDEYLQQQEQAV